MAIIKPEDTFKHSMRISALRIMKCALRMYDRTGNAKYLEYAKHFGAFSKAMRL